MKNKLYSYEISEKQIQILKLLYEKDYLQNELQEKLSMTAPNLFYHLSRLEQKELIKKKNSLSNG